MGYCMTQDESDFFLPNEKFAEALKAVQALAEQPSRQEAIQSGEKLLSHFAWVRRGFAECTTFEDIMRAWRWDVDSIEGEGIDGIDFNGEKSGDDKVLFDAIAPFVRSGSYIQMSGEDGTQWRWAFVDGKCKEITAVVSWPAV